MRESFLPKKYREFIGLGAEIAASLSIPIIVGYFIDERLGSTPIGTLSGIGLGMLLFFLIIIRISKRLGQSD